MVNKQLQYTYHPNTQEVGCEVGRLVPDPFLFFEKALYEVKTYDLLTGFNIYISIALKLVYN